MQSHTGNRFVQTVATILRNHEFQWFVWVSVIFQCVIHMLFCVSGDRCINEYVVCNWPTMFSSMCASECMCGGDVRTTPTRLPQHHNHAPALMSESATMQDALNNNKKKGIRIHEKQKRRWVPQTSARHGN